MSKDDDDGDQPDLPFTNRYDEAPGRPGYWAGLFRDFHAENPQVYAQMVKIAREAKQRGMQHWSIQGVIEVLRWHWGGAIYGVPGDGGFRINENLKSYYSREIMRREPDLDGFFRTRKSQADGEEDE